MFLDVQMPLRNGLEVMQEAKRAGILPCTMILSGYGEFSYCQKALRQNYLKIYEIAYKVGFNDEKYFYKVFRKIVGQSPSEYQKSNQI